jgi:hypothetical protein
MDRVIVYDGALPRTTDVLNLNKNIMAGLAYATRGVLGTHTEVHDLACTPGTGLSVSVGPGAIYTLDESDITAYGDLGIDPTHMLVKQGILSDPVTMVVQPPLVGGYSQYFLVQAILQELDTGPAVLPFVNSSNPSQPFEGPADTGTSTQSVRQLKVYLQMKAGNPALTGTEAIPSADVGYTALWAVHTTFNQTQIQTTDITLIPTAPYFPTLPAIPSDKQKNIWTYCNDVGSTNTLAATVYPPLQSLVPGTLVFVKVATNCTGPVTFNLNGLGAVSVRRANNAQLVSGDYTAGQVLALVYDGSVWQYLNFFGFTATNLNINNYSLSLAYAPDTGVVNAMVGLFNPAITSLSAGQIVLVLAANTNTAATTLQCNAMAPVPIYEWGGGATLQPRAILAGELVALVYDGGNFQKLNARWPYFTFDVANPPAADIPMAVGDQVNITFTNVAAVPLSIATVPGVYEIDMITTGPQTDNDPSLLPNNTNYPNKPGSYGGQPANFVEWGFYLSDCYPSSGSFGGFFSTQPNPSTFPYLTPQVSWYSSPYINPQAFGLDLFDGNERNFADKTNDYGPFQVKIVASTFTNAKMIRYSTGEVGGPCNGAALWFDTTTAWTSLGTIKIAGVDRDPVTPAQTLLSGAITVKRLA